LTGNTAWSFGLDGDAFPPGNQNLDGTVMAYFNDDILGGSSLNNFATLSTPVFDNSNFLETILEFDYNFKEYSSAVDSFYVEVFSHLTMAKYLIWNSVQKKINNT
jgi:hypothetical protein